MHSSVVGRPYSFTFNRIGCCTFSLIYLCLRLWAYLLCKAADMECLMTVWERCKTINKVQIFKHWREGPWDVAWLTLCCSPHHPVYENVKKHCRHQPAFADTDLLFRTLCVKLFYKLLVALGSQFSMEVPKTIPVISIKGFFKVIKVYI